MATRKINKQHSGRDWQTRMSEVMVVECIQNCEMPRRQRKRKTPDKSFVEDSNNSSSVRSSIHSTAQPEQRTPMEKTRWEKGYSK